MDSVVSLNYKRHMKTMLYMKSYTNKNEFIIGKCIYNLFIQLLQNQKYLKNFYNDKNKWKIKTFL